MDLEKHVFLIFTHFNRNSQRQVVFSIIQSVIFPIKASCAAFSIFGDLAPGHGRPTGLMLWIRSQRGHLYFVTCWNCIVKPQGTNLIEAFSPLETFPYSHLQVHTHTQLRKCNEISDEAPAHSPFSFSVLLLSLLEPLWVSPANKPVMSYLASFLPIFLLNVPSPQMA